MIYTLALFLLLTALAGVIAYAGDVLGTTVGRRRLSLFGWRPKRTGQVVGVTAGILIMLSTLGILSVAFRGAANALLNAQQVSQELRALSRERNALQSETARLRTEIEASQTQLAEAQRIIQSAETARDDALAETSQLRTTQISLDQELGTLRRRASNLGVEVSSLEAQRTALEESNEALEQENRSLQVVNEGLAAENATFRDNVNGLSNEVVTLQNQLGTLQRDSQRQAQRLVEAREQIEAVQGGQLTYRRGEIVYSQPIAAQEPGAVREALGTYVQEANRATGGQGAGEIILRRDQVDSLTEALVASPGEDLVVLVSSADRFGLEDVQVEVEAYENLKLLEKGQLISSRQVYLGSEGAPMSRDNIRAEVARLTQETTGRLQRIGLFEQVRPAPSPAEFDSFSSWLSRLDGTVVIGAVARESIYVNGPVELEFIIMN